MAAIQALNNSLDFVKENFEREGERNYIMQIICESTQAQDVDIQVAAFECLGRVMSLYYDFMDFYMSKALYGVLFGKKNCESCTKVRLRFSV